MAGSFEYLLVPFAMTEFDTGDEYTLSGTITTSCNDCLLDASNNIAHDLEVDGLVPHDFLGSSPIVAMGTLATPTELALIGTSSDLTFQDSAGDPICSTNCVQYVSWIRTIGEDRVTYQFLDLDGDPFVNTHFTQPNDGAGSANWVIGTIVPEPSGIGLAVVTCLAFVIRRRGI